MSEHSHGNLTLEELDRFLDQTLRSESSPGVLAATQSGLRDVQPFVDAAAVVAAFDPSELGTVRNDLRHRPGAGVLDHLMTLSDYIDDGPLRGMWSLSFLERRTALRRLTTRRTMRLSLDANTSRPDTPVQRVFELVVDGVPFELSTLPRDDLAALLIVLDWTEGILDDLPDRAAVRSALAKADLLEPMRRLAGDVFVNRDDELRQLEQYAQDRVVSPPLFIFGPGGVGKSTLLAKFILERIAVHDVPFAYLDLDRPTLRPDQPLTLYIETVAQLQRHLPEGAVNALIKEATFAIGRQEKVRYLESVTSARDEHYFFALLANQLEAGVDRPIVLILDTFEEAQYLGSDVVWQLMQFVQAVGDTGRFRIMLSGRDLPDEFITHFFPSDRDTLVDTASGDESQLRSIGLPQRPINLGVLDGDLARALLQTMVIAADIDTLTDSELDAVVAVVGRNPMCLKLAARLLRDEGVERFRHDRSEVLIKLKAEKIQALLYGRILSHIHDDEVRKVAYPGLIVRRVTPAVIRDVLAEPCGLTLTDERDEHFVYQNLEKEAALVYHDASDGSLRHRADIRRAMLDDLTEHVRPETTTQIDRAAIAFYEKHTGAVARAEEIYHRLRLRQEPHTMDAHWTPDAAEYLKSAVGELPPQQRLWLAEKLGITLDETVRRAASQEAWEHQVARTAHRLLASGEAEKALSALHERSERMPRSEIYGLEAEAYRFLHEHDEALRVARSGVEALSRAGAIDRALELQLKMVNIEEGRADLHAAEELQTEAEAVAAHSRNEILRLRVQITRLRLQRQLQPDGSDERVKLRDEALASVTDTTYHLLRSQPVLLREVAAELGEDRHVQKVALETLGFEVASDLQARALGRALASLYREQESVMAMAADPAFSSGIEAFQETDFDPGEVRRWVAIDASPYHVKIVAVTLGRADPDSEVHRYFRSYYRAGVDHMLRGEHDEGQT